MPCLPRRREPAGLSPFAPAALLSRLARFAACVAFAAPAIAQNAPATIPPGALPQSPGDGTFRIVWQAPVPPAHACPYPWSSGLWAFVDEQNPTDLNDDREYMIVGRSDGVQIVDATPPRTPGPKTIHFDKLDLPAPIDVRETPEPLPPGPERAAFDALLNSASAPYCPGRTVPIDTNLATNREAVAFFDAATQTFFVYVINSLRDGIWILRLQRETAPPHRLRLVDDRWLATGHRGHTINIDTARRLLFVLTSAVVNVFDLTKPWQPDPVNTYGPTLLHNAWRPLTPHDCLIQDGRIWVSCWQTPSVEVLSLDLLRVDPQNWTPIRGILPPFAPGTNIGFLPTMHSCWVDETSMPPVIWMLQEARQRNIAAADLSGIRYESPGPWNPPAYSYLRPPSLLQESNVAGAIPNPNAPGAPPPPSPLHHLRAEGKIGYFAHYMDGIDQVDLTDPTVPLSQSILASFDTTTLTASSPRYFWEAFLGVWDVAVKQDSGLVYASAGRENAFVFSVERGHLNRYWNATAFTPGTLQPPGAHPKVVAVAGPPRAGRPFVVRDGNRARYTNHHCIWKLYYSTVTPRGATVDPNQGNVQLNVDPQRSGVLVGRMGEDVFTLNLPSPPGRRYYLQFVVEEFQKLPNGTYVQLGVHAASRGTWFGVQH